MPANKDHADVAQSLVDYRAVYKDPILAGFAEQGRAEIAFALFRAFREWGVKLEDISGKLDVPNLADAPEARNLHHPLYHLEVYSS